MISFFQPINIEHEPQTIGDLIDYYYENNFPQWEQADIIIIGVETEYKENEGVKYAPNEIRKSLYNLFSGNWNIKIADLGNIKITDKNEIENITGQILKKNKHLIILGGTQDITYYTVKGINKTNKFVNLSIIDSTIDFDINTTKPNYINSYNYLNAILSESNLTLNNLYLIGLQTYYNHTKKIKFTEKLLIDYYKLGEIKNKINYIEPELRDSHMTSIDISSIQNSFLPAQQKSSPNGFNGIEICQIARYSGLSIKNKVLGIFETNPFFDKNHLGANQIGQIIWYYLDGKNSNFNENLVFDKDKMLKFHVQNDILKLIFYKNEATEQWWVEFKNYDMNDRIFPCSYNDYKSAVNNIISKRLTNFIKKNKI